jgi:toxin FitB
MFLIDTVVLSELRKRSRDAHVIAWMSSQSTMDLYLSTVTVGEIERGIEGRRRHDPDFARSLSLWLDRVLTLYDNRILPFDIASARRWGRLSAAIGNHSADLMIAATALEHGLTVVTRNTRHFAPTGVPVFDPFSPHAP